MVLLWAFKTPPKPSPRSSMLPLVAANPLLRLKKYKVTEKSNGSSCSPKQAVKVAENAVWKLSAPSACGCFIQGGGRKHSSKIDKHLIKGAVHSREKHTRQREEHFSPPCSGELRCLGWIYLNAAWSQVHRGEGEGRRLGSNGSPGHRLDWAAAKSQVQMIHPKSCRLHWIIISIWNCMPPL